MVDVLKTGSDWLSGKMKTYASQTVTYRRGANSVSVSATIGRTVFQKESEEGVMMEIETRDFIIHAADIVISGSEVEPAIGDYIDWVIGGETRRHEVLSIGGEAHWVWAEPFRVRRRVHTKEIGSV